MKVNVEIDCTPEEARRAMGLPDLTPIHERYVQMMLDTMQSGVKPEMIEAMMRNWADGRGEHDHVAPHVRGAEGLILS